MTHTADIHAAISLTTVAQTVTTAITNPACPRVLSVTGNQTGIAGNVVAVGTDYSGAALTDTIALSGSATVFGAAAFKTVTSLTVPARTTSGDTVSVGVADRLFTLPEVRAKRDSGTAPLADSSLFSDTQLLAAEAIVRSRFEKALRAALVPTSTTEMLDGVESQILTVTNANPLHEAPRRPLTVTAASIDGTALTATQLSALICHGDGRVLRSDGNDWSSSSGYQDLAVAITYWHGWSAVPELVKHAALLYTIRILSQGELPLGAASYSEGGPGPRFPYPGGRPHWTGDDEVDAILLEFEERTVVFA